MVESVFEVWLLLHYVYTDAPMTNAGEALRRLQAMVPEYNKNRRSAEGCMPHFLARLEAAMAHAARLRATHEQRQTGPNANPATDVDLLVRTLRPAWPASWSPG